MRRFSKFHSVRVDLGTWEPSNNGEIDVIFGDLKVETIKGSISLHVRNVFCLILMKTKRDFFVKSTGFNFILVKSFSIFLLIHLYLCSFYHFCVIINCARQINGYLIIRTTTKLVVEALTLTFIQF